VIVACSSVDFSGHDEYFNPPSSMSDTANVTYRRGGQVGHFRQKA
jgi:hypothetical protein